MFRAAVLVMLAGCNQIYGLDQTKVRPMDGRTCERGKPFEQRFEVMIAGTDSVEAARFTSTRGVAYLSLCPVGTGIAGCEIHTSSYSTDTETFAGFSKMTGISMTDVYDSYPTITSDNQHLIFSSSRTFPPTEAHIFIAATNNGSFDNPTITLMPGIDGPANEPFITGGGNVLYYSATVGQQRLFRMAGEPPLFGGSPQVIPETDLPALQEYAPVASEDELEIFFGGGERVSSLDLYTASRSTTAEPFGAPEKIAALTTSDIDYPVWISPNGCDLYYISKPNNVATLYVAKR